MIHAYYEERRPGIGVIRAGAKAFGLGEPYDLAVLADYVPPAPVEIAVLSTARFNRRYHDAIGFCLLMMGHATWRRVEYKCGEPTPWDGPVRLSLTFWKEYALMIKQSHDASVQKWTKAANTPGDAALQGLAHDVLTQVIALEHHVQQPKSFSERLQDAAPLMSAIAQLEAAGAHMPHDTPQQKAIAHAILASWEVVKHLGNASVAVAVKAAGSHPAAI